MKSDLDRAVDKFDRGLLPNDIQKRIQEGLDSYKEYLVYKELENISKLTKKGESEEDKYLGTFDQEFLDDIFKGFIPNVKESLDFTKNAVIPFVRYLIRTNSAFVIPKDEVTKEKYPMTYKQCVDIRRFMSSRIATRELFADIYAEYERFIVEIANPYLKKHGSSLFNDGAWIKNEFRAFMHSMQGNSLRPYTSKYYFFINKGDYPTSIIMPNMVKNGITRGNDLDRDVRK